MLGIFRWRNGTFTSLPYLYTCLSIVRSLKAKIAAMDPRNHLKNMSPEAQMAALGAVAAGQGGRSNLT